MTDRVVRLDLEPIKERRRFKILGGNWEGHAVRQLYDDFDALLAEVERLRSALLQPDLEPIQKLVMEWQRRASARDNDPNAGTALRAGAQHLRWCADELHKALLLCEAQGRRHEEEKHDDKTLARMDTKAGADR